MRISAKADYAVRAMVELGRSAPSEASPIKREALGARPGDPRDLPRQHPLRAPPARPGPRPPGQRRRLLARPARRDAISVADVIRAVEGPLASVRGESPDELDDGRGAEGMWIALRTNIREALEAVSVADLVAGELPEDVALDRRPLRAPGDRRHPPSVSRDPARRAASPRAARRRAGGTSRRGRSRSSRSGRRT